MYNPDVLSRDVPPDPGHKATNMSDRPFAHPGVGASLLWCVIPRFCYYSNVEAFTNSLVIGLYICLFTRSVKHKLYM